MFNCGLLLEFLLSTGTTPPLYSCLRGFVLPHFDTMTSSILIGLSRSRLKMRPVISATLPFGYRVHPMWFQSVTLLIRIRPSIA